MSASALCTNPFGMSVSQRRDSRIVASIYGKLKLENYMKKYSLFNGHIDNVKCIIMHLFIAFVYIYAHKIYKV